MGATVVLDRPPAATSLAAQPWRFRGRGISRPGRGQSHTTGGDNNDGRRCEQRHRLDAIAREHVGAHLTRYDFISPSSPMVLRSSRTAMPVRDTQSDFG